MKIKKICKKCNKVLSRNNKSGFCNSHRDRSGVNNPFYGKTHDHETLITIKEKCRIASIELWKDDEYRNEVIVKSSKPRHEDFGKEQSIRVKLWYDDNPEQRDIRSKRMKQSWDNGEIEPNINSINESKDERELRRLCSLIFDKVQKKTLKFDGKWFYPDIIIDDTHIVEFFGDYWHANPIKYEPYDIPNKTSITCEDIWNSDLKRINTLIANGYNVKVVWQSEFKANRDEVMSHIEEWYNETKNNSSRV